MAVIFFFTTKDSNDPKKNHGMNNAFLQSKQLPHEIFSGRLVSFLVEKEFSVARFHKRIAGTALHSARFP